MEKEFIPYELAVKLKELGFDEGCFGTYLWEVLEIGLDIPNDEYFIRAPLWQQAFHFFIYNYGLISIIETNSYSYMFKIQEITQDYTETVVYFETYEEARKACLEKLIEIVQNERI